MAPAGGVEVKVIVCGIPSLKTIVTEPAGTALSQAPRAAAIAVVAAGGGRPRLTRPPRITGIRCRSLAGGPTPAPEAGAAAAGRDQHPAGQRGRVRRWQRAHIGRAAAATAALQYQYPVGAPATIRTTSRCSAGEEAERPD